MLYVFNRQNAVHISWNGKETQDVRRKDAAPHGAVQPALLIKTASAG